MKFVIPLLQAPPSSFCTMLVGGCLLILILVLVSVLRDLWYQWKRNA